MTALPPPKRPHSKRRMQPKALSCWWKFWGPKIAYFISIPWNSFFSINIRVHQRGLSCPATLGSAGPIAGLFTLYPIKSEPGKFSRESHTPLSKLSHETVPSNKLCQLKHHHPPTHTQNFPLDKYISFLLSMTKCLDSKFCMCVGSREERKQRQRKSKALK